MKKLLVLFLSLLLCGCVTFNEDASKQGLNEVFKKDEDKIDYRQNNTTYYFDYYLPSDMSEVSFSDENVILNYSNSRLVMNVNIAGIISNQYYIEGIRDDGFFDENALYFSKVGNYLDVNNRYIDYLFNIYNQDDYFLLHLLSNKVNIYAFSYKGEEVETARHMLLLAKGTSVKDERILANYSTKDVVNHQRQQVDLFQYVIPKSGYLVDLIKDNENINSQ